VGGSDGQAEEQVAGLSPSHSSLPASRRLDTRGYTLRAWAARGMLINTAFNIGLTGLGLVRGFVLAAFLTRADYGVWGILIVSLGIVARLKVIGIGEKFIQQDEDNQELAFQKAFTLEVLMTALTMAVIAIVLPVVAIAYNQWKLLPPGLVLLLVLPAGALQAPFWVLAREMDFKRQRTLQSLEPVVGFVVAVGMAAAGAGYWALAFGVLAGAWTSAIVAQSTSPYRLRWRYHRDVLRPYVAFSGPLLIASACSIVLANGAVIVVNSHLGIAAVGAVALASNITAFTTRVDDLVSGTLYPAICAVKDRVDLLQESFVKSNRLALLWAMPFGVGVALFCGDLVHYVIGERWRPAVGLLQITGIVAAIAHVGYNWDDYFRARSDTRPVAVVALGAAATFVLVGIPLTLALGLRGLALGIGAQAAVALCLRAYYLTRFFESFAFVRHAARAMVPTLPAAAFVLVVREVATGSRTPARVAAELAAYGLITVIASWRMEGGLVREATGYLVRGAGRAQPVPST